MTTEPTFSLAQLLDLTSTVARDRVLAVWPEDRVVVTAREIADETRVAINHRIWVLLSLLTVVAQRHFVGWCAEQLLSRVPESDRDPRVVRCIEVVHLFADGLATSEDLTAAKVAAWNASREIRNAARWEIYDGSQSATQIARATAWAARAAADDLDRVVVDVARTAAWDTAWTEQLETLVALHS